MANPLQVGVVGATGYTGSELIRLLENHPGARVSCCTSERYPGERLDVHCPWLSSEAVLENFNPESIQEDLVFLCQEAGFAMAHVPKLPDNVRVIDLSGDYRLKKKGEYQEWYGKQHLDSDRKPWPTYGLPELVSHRDLEKAVLIANPGCYPTAALLAVKPLADAGVIAGTIVIDAKSGTSGAGRSRQESSYLFSELSGGFQPYSAAKHRHTPEIEQMIGVMVRFTPHLLPVSRGLSCTIHVPVKTGIDKNAILEIWGTAYEASPFIRIWETKSPSTKHVLGSNSCILSCEFDERTGYVVLCSVIDNLIKGAAGQAIQNMNLMFGFPEETGLPKSGVWP